MRNKKAFTLIELMIVVVILGTLSSVAIPKFADMIKKAKEGGTKGSLGAIRSAVSMFYADHEGVFPDILERIYKYPANYPTINEPYIYGKYIGIGADPEEGFPIYEKIDWTDGARNGNAVCDWDDVDTDGAGPDGVFGEGPCSARPYQSAASERGGWNYCPFHGVAWLDEIGLDTKNTCFTSW